MSTAVFKFQRDEEQIVWAEVYAPMVPDSDLEYMDAEGIKAMAYRFMRDGKLRMVDTQHTNELVPDACIVESFIAREGDPIFTPGAWVVAVHIPDAATWARVKSGELNGFSMEAMVNKEPHLVEIEVPHLCSGVTEAHPEDGHKHTFMCGYDNNMNFLGGKTDEVNGHYHVILMGTVTEDSQGHSHRFDHIQQTSLQEINGVADPQETPG